MQVPYLGTQFLSWELHNSLVKKKNLRRYCWDIEEVLSGIPVPSSWLASKLALGFRQV